MGASYKVTYTVDGIVTESRGYFDKEIMGRDIPLIIGQYEAGGNKVTVSIETTA